MNLSDFCKTHFLKLLYDEYRERIKLVVTGSSAFYIDEKFKDSLAGRKRIFELKTLDFDLERAGIVAVNAPTKATIPTSLKHIPPLAKTTPTAVR